MQLSMNIPGLTVLTVRLHRYSSQSIKPGERAALCEYRGSMEQVALEYCKREMAHLHDAEKQELDCARLVAKGLPREVEHLTLL